MFAQQEIWVRDFGISFQKWHDTVSLNSCTRHRNVWKFTLMCVNAQWSVMEPYVCICVILHLGDQTNILLFRNCFCCRWNRCVHNQHWVDLRTWCLKLDSECHWLYNGPAGAFEIQWMAVEVIFSGHSSSALYSYCQLST